MGSEAYVAEVNIPGLPPLANVMLRGDWRKRLGPIRKWKTLVQVHFATRRPPEALKKAKLTLTRHSARRPDFDGLASSFKPVIDALVEMHILADDSFDVIAYPNYEWGKAPQGKGYITVRVEAV